MWYIIHLGQTRNGSKDDSYVPPFSKWQSTYWFRIHWWKKSTSETLLHKCLKHPLLWWKPAVHHSVFHLLYNFLRQTKLSAYKPPHWNLRRGGSPGDTWVVEKEIIFGFGFFTRASNVSGTAASASFIPFRRKRAGHTEIWKQMGKKTSPRIYQLIIDNHSLLPDTSTIELSWTCIVYQVGVLN